MNSYFYFVYYGLSVRAPVHFWKHLHIAPNNELKSAFGPAFVFRLDSFRLFRLHSLVATVNFRALRAAFCIELSILLRFVFLSVMDFY